VSDQFSPQTILELACAAQRHNGSYIKEVQWIYDEDNNPLYRKEPNRFLINFTLGLESFYDDVHRPEPLTVTEEDKTQAEEIKKYFRKLMFSAVKGDNDFNTEVNGVLHAEFVGKNKFGYIACLPSVYQRDVQTSYITKKIKHCDDGYLSPVGKTLLDHDCEILEVRRSNNFDAWNICAIIENKLVTWFSSKELKAGPCVIIKAKIKEHRDHWKYHKSETRLNYVKTAQ
jgi:hypothetical protein